MDTDTMEMEAEADVVEYKGFTIKIWPELYPENPRTFTDHLGIFNMYHRRYEFGDKKKFEDHEEFARYVMGSREVACYYPVYAYDHGGIVLSVSNEHYPFNDQWDAGLLGYIYTTRERIRDTYCVSRATKKRVERARKELKAEIDTMNDYLAGRVYMYSTEDKDGISCDTCAGFYGEEGKKYALEEAKSLIDVY